MNGPRYTIDVSTGAAATIGLLVLSVDETVESDMRRLFPSRDVALHVSRLPSGADLTTESIQAMEAEVPRAASLLPARPHYAAIGYACTSGATLIGPERVAEMVREVRDVNMVTNPLSAVLEECKLRGLTRIGLVSPYTADIGAPVAAALNAHGVSVVSEVHFGEAVEANVARIAPESIRSAAEAVCARGAPEAVFVSCTNLRTLDLVGPLEHELRVPVLTSNLSMARALGRAAGVDVVWPPECDEITS